MSSIDDIVNKYPTGSTFYYIIEGKGNSWIGSDIVYGYRVIDDDIYLLALADRKNAFISHQVVDININNCYTSRLEASKFLPEPDETVRIAVDNNGREIDFALFEDEHTIDVIPDYSTHVEHCCVIHGCKYNDPKCPVASGKLLQKYVCEKCTNTHDNKNFFDIRNKFNELRVRR